MNEEEKKAIIIVKCWADTFKEEEYLDFIAHDESDAEALETVLNLIKKQQQEIEQLNRIRIQCEKEIEELKSDNYELNCRLKDLLESE